MYLMLCTRFETAFPISVLSRFQAKPTNAYMSAAKRVLRYLRRTRDLALTLSGTLTEPRGFYDVDWAGCTETRQSTGGYIFNVGSAAISWQSKRQLVVATSICEAEYMSQTIAAKEAIWLRNLYAEILQKPLSKPTLIEGDNRSALDLARNARVNVRSKHIDIQWHFVREKVREVILQLQHMSTTDQCADLMTKALPRVTFDKHRVAAGLQPILEV